MIPAYYADKFASQTLFDRDCARDTANSDEIMADLFRLHPDARPGLWRRWRRAAKAVRPRSLLQNGRAYRGH